RGRGLRAALDAGADDPRRRPVAGGGALVMFAPLPGPESDLPERVAEGIARLRADFQGLEARLDELAHLAGVDGEPAWTRLRIFHGYVGVFVAAFVVTLLATPLMRRLAVANGIIDRPSELRKTHRMPVAYLGGV